MAHRLIVSLAVAGLLTGPALAQDSEPLAALMQAADGLGNHDSATGMRNAAWAHCILFGHEQTALTGFFDEAGWSRQDYEDGAFSLHAPDTMAEKLWVMLYEDDTSCSVNDQLTSTFEARATIGEMLDHPAFTVEDLDEEDDCLLEQVTLAPVGGNPGSAFTFRVRSGGDYGDCSSESASAVTFYDAG